MSLYIYIVMAMIQTKVSARNQTTIPSKIRKKYNVQPNDIVEWKENSNGELKVTFRKRISFRDMMGKGTIKTTTNAVDLEKLEGYMNEDYANIQIVGTATLEENAVSDDMLLNLVNGAEVDCVLSTLSSPTEEEFIYRNKTLVNARVWLGFGELLGEMRKQKNVFLKVKEFVLRQILKREMAKKGENA